MERITFKITVNASRSKVWDILWNPETYPQWTAAFCEGSRAISDWQKGSKVLFVDGAGSGMLSRIREIIPDTYMSFEHYGEVVEGKEDTTSDRVKQWAGALENYTLTDVNGATELFVETDLVPEYVEMMSGMWPNALDNLKNLAEK